MEFIAEISIGGTLKFYREDLVCNALFPLANKQVHVTVSEHRKKRSDGQNRWYWGVAISKCIIPFLYETQGESYTKDEIHSFHLCKLIQAQFTTKIVMDVTVLIFNDLSTSKMNTLEFNQFKEKIQKYWAEKGLDIPDPVANSFINEYE